VTTVTTFKTKDQADNIAKFYEKNVNSDKVTTRRSVGDGSSWGTESGHGIGSVYSVNSSTGSGEFTASTSDSSLKIEIAPAGNGWTNVTVTLTTRK
jgi:hypothetical protein